MLKWNVCIYLGKQGRHKKLMILSLIFMGLNLNIYFSPPHPHIFENNEFIPSETNKILYTRNWFYIGRFKHLLHDLCYCGQGTFLEHVSCDVCWSLLYFYSKYESPWKYVQSYSEDSAEKQWSSCCCCVLICNVLYSRDYCLVTSEDIFQ